MKPNNDFEQSFKGRKNLHSVALINAKGGSGVTPSVVFMKRQYFVFTEYDALKV